jgi:pimeloyl-ACP methyl ester carboxylesterase
VPAMSAPEGILTTSKTPVVFIHGQPGLGSDFSLVEQLLDHTFQVISPDRPGYGTNPRNVSSMAENVEWFKTLLADSFEEPSVVVGHSYGGGIAILLGALHPELVSGLVLASSVASVEHVGTLDRVLASRYLGDALVAGGLGAAGSILPVVRQRTKSVPGRVGRWMEVNLPDSTFAKVAPPLGRVWRSVMAEQRSLLSEMPLVESSLHELDMPVEVVAGTWDVIVPPAVAKKAARTIRDAELLLVPRVGHFLPRDAPEVLAEAVRRVSQRTTAR